MGWVLLIGVVLIVVGIIVGSLSEANGSDDGEIVGFIMLIVGIVLVVIGFVGWFVEASNEDTLKEVHIQEIASSQGLTVIDVTPSSATVVGDNCTLTGELVDDKLVLTGSDPAIVLTPDYVDLVCQGAAR